MASRDRERTAELGKVTISHDPVSEGVLLAAAMADKAARRRVLTSVPIDKIFEPKHKEIFTAMVEAERRKLEVDAATLATIGEIDSDYLDQLTADRPELPANLDYHIERVMWDGARLEATKGPIAQLVDALKDPLTDPSRIKALARQVPQAFEGYKDRKYLRDGVELVREMMTDLRARNEGVQSYGYGLQNLDYYETPDRDGNPIRRMVPGSMPGKATVITGMPGVGKSTFTAALALGMARQKRRVLYGAWEMRGNMTLELLACMSLKMSRKRFHLPRAMGGLTHEELVSVEEKAHSIARYIRFLDLPFNRQQGEKRKGANERNLDIIHGYIADSGCDVFIADLWKRCLMEIKPEDEELALERMQAILEETQVHGILVHQQLSKGDQVREDNRPTAQGAKGSSMWREFADTMMGVHRPALYKAVDDNIFEVILLKQRYGEWPQTIEFDWVGATGNIYGGKTVPYDGASAHGSRMDDFFEKEAKPRGGRRK